MENKKITVAGAGCCLVDRIFNNIDFESEVFKKYVSKKQGDGGMILGGLEFEEKFEAFAGKKFPDVLKEITGDRDADKVNIGGPCIVALINAAQLAGENAEVEYFGCYGDDKVGENLLQALRRTPVKTDFYRMEQSSETASTTVFSDPNYDEGHGERIFVNTIGASWKFLPNELPDKFYEADINVFGATALVPQLHEQLDTLMKKSKQYGSFTFVNLVYDSINERKFPNGKWPIGSSEETFKYIDVLIADREEAIRTSGCDTIEDAMKFFQDKGVGAAVVTNGAKDVYFYANEGLFNKVQLTTLPVSAEVGVQIKQGRRGDTTGCGDNFAGGVLYSIINQKSRGAKPLDIIEACRWGIVSGGFACFYVGGTYFESAPGEKKAELDKLYKAYMQQTGMII